MKNNETYKIAGPARGNQGAAGIGQPGSLNRPPFSSRVRNPGETGLSSRTG